MTLTPRLNRYLAGLASLVLICGLAACTKTVDGSARYSGARPSSDQPLVKITQLPELLPSAGEVGEVMGGPGFVAALSYRSLESVPDDTVSDPHCVGVVFGAVEPVYRGSGYQGAYGHRIVNPMLLSAGRVDEGAVAFGSAEEAQAFVSQQTGAWRDCAGRAVDAESRQPASELDVQPTNGFQRRRRRGPTAGGRPRLRLRPRPGDGIEHRCRRGDVW